MASRKLIVEIVGDSRSFERSLSRSTNATRKFSVGIGTILKSAVVFGAVTRGADLMGDAIRAGFAEFSDAAKAAAQTNAVIKSTGGVANVTAKHVDRLASSIQGLSGIDDEAIKRGENLLLTFKNVRNEVGQGNAIFDRATKAAVDLSVAGFGALETTSKQLGKALNDPVRGMTALARAGVTFTEGQKKTIKSLVETGRTLEAQRLILKEVESQVGGSAKALGDTLPGQLSKLRESLKNTLGDIAGSIAPSLTRALGSFNDFIAELGKARTVSAKLRVVATGLESIGRDILREVQTRIAAIDWNAVGRSLGQFLTTAFNRTAEFLASVDWAAVGGAIVRGIGNFLRGVNWKAVAVATIKLLVAAIKAAASLLLGIGKELGGALIEGIGRGIDAASQLVLRKLLQFVDKILGITSFLGRFDPLKGTRERVRATLDAMVADAESAASRTNRALEGIRDQTVTVTVATVVTGEGPGAGETATRRRVSPAASAITKAVDDVLKGARKAADATIQAGKKIATVTEKAATETEASAKKVKKATDRQRKSFADIQRAQREAVQAAQFRALGLTATGDQPAPTIANLRKQLASLTERIAGTSLDTSKTRGLLARIRKVLTDPISKATVETRDKIRELFETIRSEFDRGSKTDLAGPLTKTMSINASKIFANVTGLSRDQIRQIRANLTPFNSAGLALARPTSMAGATFGDIAGGRLIVVENNNTLTLDSQVLARSTTRSQTKTGRGTRQKRGPNRRSGI